MVHMKKVNLLIPITTAMVATEFNILIPITREINLVWSMLYDVYHIIGLLPALNSDKTNPSLLDYVK
jgi:hypothetical protein